SRASKSRLRRWSTSSCTGRPITPSIGRRRKRNSGRRHVVRPQGRWRKTQSHGATPIEQCLPLAPLGPCVMSDLSPQDGPKPAFDQAALLMYERTDLHPWHVSPSEEGAAPNGAASLSR